MNFIDLFSIQSVVTVLLLLLFFFFLVCSELERF